MADITVDYIDHMGDDLTVVNAARVSFDKASEQFCDNDARLIRYLARHKHTSPFNHAFASFRVTAPIFVARQLVKHKFLVWNEVSRRYVDDEPTFYTPETWRKRPDDSIKQGSSDERVDLESMWQFKDGDEDVMSIYAESVQLYNHLLDQDVAPEQARMVLPQSMMTSWWWSGSLGAFADMCRLRLDNHAQYESRLVAQQIADHMSRLYPVAWAALLEESDQ